MHSSYRATTTSSSRSNIFLFYDSNEGISRPAAILFHGMTGSPGEMQELGQRLYERGFDVYIPCLSGHRTDINELKLTKASAWYQDAETVFSQAREKNPGGIFLIGLSFGSVLCLYLAEKYPDICRGIVLMSVPLRMRSRLKEAVMSLLSKAPDRILDLLGLQEKPKWREKLFSKPREAFSAHSLAAIARLQGITKVVRKKLGEIRSPILIMQDPLDHHLSPSVPLLLAKSCSSVDITMRWFPDGLHELTLGGKRLEVFVTIENFINRLTKEGSSSHAS